MTGDRLFAGGQSPPVVFPMLLPKTTTIKAISCQKAPFFSLIHGLSTAPTNSRMQIRLNQSDFWRTNLALLLLMLMPMTSLKGVFSMVLAPEGGCAQGKGWRKIHW